MKLKDGFMLRQIGTNYVVVPVGGEVVDFNGMIHLNESGSMLWEALQKECTKEDLIKVLLDAYDVTEEQSSADADKFINKLSEAGLLE